MCLPPQKSMDKYTKNRANKIVEKNCGNEFLCIPVKLIEICGFFCKKLFQHDSIVAKLKIQQGFFDRKPRIHICCFQKSVKLLELFYFIKNR